MPACRLPFGSWCCWALRPARPAWPTRRPRGPATDLQAGVRARVTAKGRRRSQSACQATGRRRSLAELAQVVAKTMPEDDPGTLAGDDAERRGRVHLQRVLLGRGPGRNRPARVELSRLTVRNIASGGRPGGQLPLDWQARRGARAAGRLRQDARGMGRKTPWPSSGSIRRSISSSAKVARMPTRSRPRSSASAGKVECWPPRPASTNSSSTPKTGPSSA